MWFVRTWTTMCMVTHCPLDKWKWLALADRVGLVNGWMVGTQVVSHLVVVVFLVRELFVLISWHVLKILIVSWGSLFSNIFSFIPAIPWYHCQRMAIALSRNFYVHLLTFLYLGKCIVAFSHFYTVIIYLSLIHIWRCRRSTLCRFRWSPYH